jgi:hypothetical protein
MESTHNLSYEDFLALSLVSSTGIEQKANSFLFLKSSLPQHNDGYANSYVYSYANDM